ncbi:hypothetical protein MKX03_027561 [Papaver bracteatum]|nr:hypothetical protein MKX03_027561 [Papaver bracteatum]
MSCCAWCCCIPVCGDHVMTRSEMKKGWEDSTANNFITKLELRFILIILFIKLSVNQPKKMH